VKIAVLGIGYVGSVTAAGLASQGHDVWCVDPDTAKIQAINAGLSPVTEPGMDALVAGAVAAGRLHATTDLVEAIDGAELSLLCVGTPSTPQGSTDLSSVRTAVDGVAAALKQARPSPSGNHCIVMRSTVPPGTGAEIVEPGVRDVGAHWNVGTAMCPEFLREGSSIDDFFAPPFLVIGTAHEFAVDSIKELFGFLDAAVHVVDVRTAEALKYACNAFHATKISFANEMGRLMRHLGVDSREVMRIFREDLELNISGRYLQPGFAFGGSCLPKDVRSMLYLARVHNADLPLLAGALASNETAVRDLVDRIVAGPARSVALLGLSFKSDTDDLRESPMVELAERLLGKGFDVRIFDPIVNPARLRGSNLRQVRAKLPHLGALLADTADEVLDGAELAVVATTEPATLSVLAEVAPPLVIDLVGRLGDAVEALPGYAGVAW
jgi:GDP-mannose 6-dehydrogenase